ncbi:aldo/keto reductase [Actinoplanes sp. NPDC051346]|uniref:aldo/keto reductase n=1 Tax=Actinoplanes sp. NPDC051346 TaxID=3155048 RepID=UPI0034478EDD
MCQARANGGGRRAWLRARPELRDRLVIATKGRFAITGQPGAGLSREYLHRALDASLRRLGVERVDLYQAHGPDRRVPLGEGHGVGTTRRGLAHRQIPPGAGGAVRQPPG